MFGDHGAILRRKLGKRKPPQPRKQCGRRGVDEQTGDATEILLAAVLDAAGERPLLAKLVAFCLCPQFGASVMFVGLGRPAWPRRGERLFRRISICPRHTSVCRETSSGPTDGGTAHGPATILYPAGVGVMRLLARQEKASRRGKDTGQKTARSGWGHLGAHDRRHASLRVLALVFLGRQSASLFLRHKQKVAQQS
jgi:hypothetical protein